MINVNLIRVWSGGLHDILEAIWAAKFESCSGLIQPQIFENICPPDAKVPTKVHYECQNEMWAAELMRPERYALFTEFDFLPVDPTWGLDLMNQTGAAVVASEHIKPNFHYSRWKRTPITGPWWMLFDKQAIVEAGLQLSFKPFDNGALTTLEDPAARVRAAVEAAGLKVHLERCEPHPLSACSAWIGRLGIHLFNSRHFLDERWVLATLMNISASDIQDKATRITLDYVENYLTESEREAIQEFLGG